ncbi:MAG TPA: hypothetical protein VN026_11140 [Bacteroidia bacterium]|jgi:hypothetical protein|nr:hypothetical protein [Bacteroidia bacterium]
MIDKLKTFVSNNREKFDSKEPKQDLWEKIDARMETKNSFRISSKWLSRFKYISLSASVLIVAVYFISKNLNNSSANELAQNRRDSAMNNSEEWVKANQNRSETKHNQNNNTNEAGDFSGSKNESTSSIAASSNNKEQREKLIQDSILNNKKDSVVLKTKSLENNISELNKIKPEGASHPLPKEEEKPIINNENNLIGKNKSLETLVPAEPEKMNVYSGTLYDGSYLCSILRAYKFPGQVSMDGTMRTTGCSRLENITNMKAIWLKGKTNKRITLAVKEGFKNIKLVKSDGRELLPEAISHYYKGLGVISGYTGKYFNLFFKNKVELILFFKDAEEGDKIVIDGTIEAVVKNKL